VLCYSGICSATVFMTESTDQIGSHCDMANHDAAYSSDNSQLFIQNVSTFDLQSSQCCYEGLTNSSIENNLAYKALDILYLLDIPTSLGTGNSKSIGLIFTKNVHDPPDIYLSVSSFLL